MARKPLRIIEKLNAKAGLLASWSPEMQKTYHAFEQVMPLKSMYLIVQRTSIRFDIIRGRKPIYLCTFYGNEKAGFSISYRMDMMQKRFDLASSIERITKIVLANGGEVRQVKELMSFHFSPTVDNAHKAARLMLDEISRPAGLC